MIPDFLAGRRFPLGVGAVGLLALCLRILYLHEIETSPLFQVPVVDARTYVEDALYLSGESWLGRPEPFWQPPLYPYILAFLFSLFGENYYLPRLLQAFMGVAVCMLTCLIGRRFFSPTIALGAGLVAALYGPLIYIGGELLPTLLSIFLNLLLLLLLLRLPASARWAWLLVGLLLGVAGLAVGNILLFLPVLLFWLWRTRQQLQLLPSRTVQQSLLLLSGCALVIAPVALRNYRVGGDQVLISHNAGINFYIGNNLDYDDTVGIRPGRDWAQLVEMPEREADIELPSAKSRFFFARSWEFMRTEPLAYIRLLLRKTYLFWRGDEILRNLDPYFARRDSLILSVLLWKYGLAFPFGLVSPLALIGLVAFWRAPAGRTPRGRLLLLFTLTYAVSVVVFFITSRYRLPVVPLLLLFAGFGFSACLSSARRIRLLLALAILLLLANVGIPPMDMEGEPQQHLWLGYAYEKKGMPANAIREYKAAIEGMPDHENALLCLAALYSGQKRPLKAIEAYQQYLRAYPASERVSFLLANTYLAVGQYEKSISFYEKLASQKPQWAELHGRLGYAHLMAGQPDRAAVAYRRTLELKPDTTLVRYQLARLYQARGERAAAIEEYRRLLELGPERAEYHVYLADLLVEREEASSRREGEERETILLESTVGVRQAEEHLRLAISQNAGFVLPYWKLGLLLARQNRYAEAVISFERIAEITPLDHQVHACLGNLYERMGRKEEAQERFARSARLAREARLQSKAQTELRE
jgi:tetratricopeptide (TPR) repeat protein/4-amino-4-deoxy-L-arabinose transferase-like glycosyltransferase